MYKLLTKGVFCRKNICASIKRDIADLRFLCNYSTCRHPFFFFLFFIDRIPELRHFILKYLMDFGLLFYFLIISICFWSYQISWTIVQIKWHRIHFHEEKKNTWTKRNTKEKHEKKTLKTTELSFVLCNINLSTL